MSALFLCKLFTNKRACKGRVRAFKEIEIKVMISGIRELLHQVDVDVNVCVCVLEQNALLCKYALALSL
jgi:hypothetical protein